MQTAFLYCLVCFWENLMHFTVVSVPVKKWFLYILPHSPTQALFFYAFPYYVRVTQTVPDHPTTITIFDRWYDVTFLKCQM